MKRFLREIAVIIIAIAASSGATAQTKWHNPENAPFPVIQGQKYQGEEREGFYNRFPARAKDKVRKSVWNLSRQNAGESIVFMTDAKNITVRYTVALRHAMPHMPSTGVSGVDLYTTDGDGNEVWVAGKYSFKDTVTFRYNDIDIVNKARKYHRYTLYLPLYNELKWLEIGTEEGAAFRFEPTPASKPIVAYGTSICQGACASRPGMAWTNMLQRRLGHEVVNIGFSGNAMLEAPVIDLVAEIDAAAYIIDAMPNTCAMEAEQLRDTLTKAVRQLREKRPDAPIILADHLGYPDGKAFKVRRDRTNNAWTVQKEVYDMLKNEGMDKLYHITHEEIALPQDGTVDGTHPTDYGMIAYADAYEKVLREVLNTPKGKTLITTPVTQQRDSYDWMARHINNVAAGNGKHFRRVIIGDSIIHFWGGADDAPSKRGEEVWKKFEGASLNLGCGYDRIENVLWRIYHGELDGLTADNIYLAIGTNNVSAGNTAEEIKEGLTYVINAIRTRRPEAKITLMGILPRRNREDQIKELNKELKALAKEIKTDFADPGRTLLLKNGKIDESLFKDGLHPNKDGYSLIAPFYN